MTYYPLLLCQPRTPYSASFLTGLAETQDRHFAGTPEGLLGHMNDWESKVAPRAFYLVAGTHRYQDGRRATKHCTTFQTKADALEFAGRWRLNCPEDEIRLLTGDVTWHEFAAETKTDQAAVKKFRKPTSRRPSR